jgi:hypothetical protein
VQQQDSKGSQARRAFQALLAPPALQDSQAPQDLWSTCRRHPSPLPSSQDTPQILLLKRLRRISRCPNQQQHQQQQQQPLVSRNSQATA